MNAFRTIICLGAAAVCLQWASSGCAGAGAPRTIPDDANSESVKASGLALMNDGDYEGALAYYRRALAPGSYGLRSLRKPERGLLLPG